MGLRADVAKAIFIRQNITSAYDVGEFWDSTSNAESFKMRAFYDADAAIAVMREAVLSEVDSTDGNYLLDLRERLLDVFDEGPTTPLLR